MKERQKLEPVSSSKFCSPVLESKMDWWWWEIKADLEPKKKQDAARAGAGAGAREQEEQFCILGI